MKTPNIDFKRMADDFRQLDPNDPGLWPVVPRFVVLAAILIAGLTAGWWFVWSDQLTELEQKQQEEQRLKDDWLNKKRQAVNLDEYKKQLAEIDRQFGALLKQLPNRSEMESLLMDVNQAGRGRGLQFDLWKPGTESIREFYAELPISLRVMGSYADLGTFASDVAKLPRIVTLSNMSISQEKDGLLKMDAQAVTYRYLDEEEVAKQRREKSAKDAKK